MKRVLRSVFVFCAVSMLWGCASNKENVSEDAGDVYELNSSLPVGEHKQKSTNKTNKKKSGFSLGGLFASKYSEYGEGSIFTSKAFGGRKQESVAFVVYPKNETAGFGSHYMASYYYLTFDDLNRKLLTSAMKEYLKDFDEKKLNRDDKKSFKAYGKVNCNLRWGTIKDSNPYYYDKASLSVGYKFEDKSPYFTISMESVVDEGSAATAKSSTDVIMSVRLNYYLTKNQCRTFIENLSDDKIADVFDIYNISLYGTPEDDDFYSEASFYSSDEVEEVE